MRSQNTTRLLANNDICLITQPQIAKLLGRTESTLLQQLHYWLTTQSRVGVIIEEQRWIYNSYKAWAQIIGMSESTVRRAISKLEDLGIILSQNLNKKKYDQTKWYSIDYQALKGIVPSFTGNKVNGLSSSSLASATALIEQKHLVKMNTPVVQNEHIIKEDSEIHTDTKELKLVNTKFITSITKTIISDSQNENTSSSSAIKDRDLPVHMLAVWNQVVEQGSRVCALTKKRARYLITALRSKFDNCLKRWKAFCEHITSSKLLMGHQSPTFRASLDWVLKFDTLQRIFEGDFGLSKFTYSAAPMDEDVQAEIEASTDNLEIKTLRTGLLSHFGQAVYKAWFQDIKISSGENGISLKFQNRFSKDWIETHYMSTIKELFSHWVPEASVKIYN